MNTRAQRDAVISDTFDIARGLGIDTTTAGLSGEGGGQRCAALAQIAAALITSQGAQETSFDVIAPALEKIGTAIGTAIRI